MGSWYLEKAKKHKKERMTIVMTSMIRSTINVAKLCA